MINKQKYPIGTKIRFLNSHLDTGKMGNIVGYYNTDKPVVYLPTADKHIKENRYPILDNGIRFTWKCGWVELELIVRINQQLEFAFMNE